MLVPIAALVAAICALLLLVTAIDTVRHRVRAGAAFGDGGGDAKLISASRSHANLAEHAPIIVLLIAFLELSHAPHTALMAIGALFLAGRVSHIIGLYMPMSTNPPLPRSLGVMTTWLTLAALSGWTLWMLFALNL